MYYALLYAVIYIMYVDHDQPQSNYNHTAALIERQAVPTRYDHDARPSLSSDRSMCNDTSLCYSAELK